MLELLQKGKPQFIHGAPEVWFDGLYTKEEKALVYEAYGFPNLWEADLDTEMTASPLEDADSSTTGTDRDKNTDDEDSDVDIDLPSEESAARSESQRQDEEMDDQYEDSISEITDDADGSVE